MYQIAKDKQNERAENEWRRANGEEKLVERDFRRVSRLDMVLCSDKGRYQHILLYLYLSINIVARAYFV
jgi:hypothetical protein